MLVSSLVTRCAMVPGRVASIDSGRWPRPVCRGPGCEIPADRCDLDHEILRPAGSTMVANLSAKHRRCHNVKTAGLFRSQPAADSGQLWTTPAGREYVTYPKDWREALPDCDIQTSNSPDDPPPF